MLKGIIVNINSNRFKVLANDKEYICSARGKFRNDKIIPLVGDNVLFNENDPKAIYNLLIKYFNDATYHSEDFEPLMEYDFQNNIELFYLIPFYIFIIHEYVKKLLSNIQVILS